MKEIIDSLSLNIIWALGIAAVNFIIIVKLANMRDDKKMKHSEFKPLINIKDEVSSMDI
jgi:hypothetical protein